MKSITFRPLRKVNKTGKIVVASYEQWRKVKTANYHNFNLTIDTEYRDFNDDSLVCNHKGEQLFFFDIEPDKIPVFDYPHDLESIRQHNEFYGLRYGGCDLAVHYNCRGLDCDGVPTFSHYTADQIANAYKLSSMDKFELLTVGMVKKWYGWFLYNLRNAKVCTS